VIGDRFCWRLSFILLVFQVLFPSNRSELAIFVRSRKYFCPIWDYR